MSDIVVTVPINFTHPCAPGLKGLAAWIAEGDAAGDEYSGQEWFFSCWGTHPRIYPGERVYVVCEDRLRGHSPLLNLLPDIESQRKDGRGRFWFVRGGGAEAVTIPTKVNGFRGWRYRWWDRADEVPFPDWKTADLRNVPKQKAKLF